MFAFRLMRYVDLYTTQLDNLIDVPLAHKYFPAVYSFLLPPSNRECPYLMNHLVVISNIPFAFIWIISTKKIHNFLLFCYKKKKKQQQEQQIKALVGLRNIFNHFIILFLIICIHIRNDYIES